MNPVGSCRPRPGSWLVWAILALAAIRPAPAAAESRLMIGESIHVLPDERLDSVMCFACSILVEGVVEDSAVVILGELTNQGAIQRDALVIIGALESAGAVGGDAVAVAGSMDLQNDVGGNAVAILANLAVEAAGVNIGGDIVTIMGELGGSFSGSVGGAVRQVGGSRVGQLLLSGMLGALVLAALGFAVLALALNLLGYFLLGTKRLATIADSATGNAAVCFLIGLGTCFALLVIGLIVAMLLPVSMPIALLLSVVSVVGYSGLTYGVGRNLFPHLSPLAATVFAGLLLVAAQLIPFVGWLVLPVVWNIAIGSAVLSGFGTSPDWLTERAYGA